MRLFFALAAIHCLIITFGDTTNAFQQSPPPTRKCYLRIDDAYASWYYKRFGILLDRSAYVIPVERALQGHPEAGRLWETMIVEILSKKGFKSTTHERNLYYGFMHGKTKTTQGLVALRDYCREGFNVAWDQTGCDRQSSTTHVNVHWDRHIHFFQCC
jgi:hypothetical protein